MAPPLRVTLDQAAHDELDRRYQTTRDATTRTRYQMILLRAEGHRVPEVAQLTRCSPDTVRRVLKRYLAGGRTRCRTGPIWASRPTTRPPGSRSWSGWPTATPTRLGWTARVEALLAAAAVPPPAACLVPDATLAAELVPEELPRLLGLLGRADRYLQDEVEVALHPTLTRCGPTRRPGRPPAGPGARQELQTVRRWAGGLARGWLDLELAQGRRAAPLCAQLR